MPDPVAWQERIAEIRALDYTRADPETLEAIKRAIRRCPYAVVSDAIMHINGCWEFGERYDLCLSALMADGSIRPKAYGIFDINRKMLPLEEVKSALNIPLVSTTPIRREPKLAEVPKAEPEPDQFSLF